MNMDVIKSFTEQMQGFAAPLTRYNQLLASNIEQLTRLQLASANAYAELGLNQLQAVGKVQDAQSLAVLGTVQLESASQLSRQMLDDIQKLSALGQQFKEELAALLQHLAQIVQTGLQQGLGGALGLGSGHGQQLVVVVGQGLEQRAVR